MTDDDERIRHRKHIISKLLKAVRKSAPSDEAFRERALGIIEEKKAEIEELLKVANPTPRD